jgi:hypothetical protein
MWTPSDPLPTPSEPGGSADSRSARDQRKQLRLQLIQLRDARRDVAQLVGQRVDADEDLELDQMASVQLATTSASNGGQSGMSLVSNCFGFRWD